MMAKSKQIAALLRTDMSMASDLAQIAKMLEKKGRGNDTILAHITKKEAEILKDMGGAGTVNPDTGLLEFYDGEFLDASSVPASSEVAFEEAPIQYDTPSLPAYDPYAGFGFEGLPEAAPAAVSAPVAAPIAPVSPAVSAIDRGALVPTAPGVTTARGAADFAGAGATVPPPQEKSFFDKLTTQDLIRLGLAGGLGLYGAQSARAGAKQAAGAQREVASVGRPYQEQGQALVGAAMRGELTPTGQQSLQALQARMAQGVEARGGVGAAQAAAQVEAFRQQLLQGQYDYGLKVTNIGDQIALGAIKTGMQADSALRQASSNFYTNLAAIAGGLPIRS